MAIKEWLVQHSINDYVVLDDVAKFFPGKWPSLILCNSALGISDPIVEKALRSWVGGDAVPLAAQPHS